MHTTLRCDDIIYEAVNRLVVAVIMLKSNFNIYIILNAFAVNNLVIDGCLALVEVFYEFLDTAFIVEGFFNRLLRTKIRKAYLQILRKEGSLSESDLQSLKIIDNIIKYGSIRLEGYSCTGLICLAHNLKVVADISSLIPLLIYLAIS